ncbi:hypothetical protein TNIN_176331 [Trichonephila inaurata madagascariensis]|uniref:Uncharacterized protein n=1 Tax=Trichonephila inaurata madagascariensis TaxID=2747483 RepID=A0A8X6XR80_9ARAC|nr:hypothetical protein TNIN_176331 [Trichonephila inaurata madagascariensis]
MSLKKKPSGTEFHKRAAENQQKEEKELKKVSKITSFFFQIVSLLKLNPQIPKLVHPVKEKTGTKTIAMDYHQSPRLNLSPTLILLCLCVTLFLTIALS